MQQPDKMEGKRHSQVSKVNASILVYRKSIFNDDRFCRKKTAPKNVIRNPAIDNRFYWFRFIHVRMLLSADDNATNHTN